MANGTSPKMEAYFHNLDEQVKKCYAITEAARKKGLDPEETPPIPLAKNMAERVVGLISVVAPQILGTNVTQRILELEQQYGTLDWRVGFKIAEEVAKEQCFPCKSKQEAIEIGIRVGFAYLTLGIVSAPLEGFIGLKIKQRKDGKEYFAIQYAGPIRGAGGTAASTSVILSDYVRIKMGYAPYDPQEEEINRYVIEIQDYHERVTNLQYFPSEQEIRFLTSHLPVEVDGDPTEVIEVSNYKDLSRIETNLIRGGMALVVAEGLTQKAPKLWKRLSKWGKEFGLDWSWLSEFIKLKEQIHSAHSSKAGKPGSAEQKKVKPNNTFIMDSVAGRPVLTHPLGTGGFRLRYGRTRLSGFSATALHPATLIVLDKYIAIGTQLKVERPGKAASVTICDRLEGPIVRLTSGDVLQFHTEEEARQLNPQVEKILFLGDILFNYGDFSENGQQLVPPGYCPEWWALEVEKAIHDTLGSLDFKKASSLLTIPAERLRELLADPQVNFPSWDEACRISTSVGVPLHPNYTWYWKCVSGSEVFTLKEWLKEGKVKIENGEIRKIILPYYSSSDLYPRGKAVLDNIGCPHKIISKEHVFIDQPEAVLLAHHFGFKDQASLESLSLSEQDVGSKDGLEVIRSLSPLLLRDKAGTFVGARMGRPEKAKMRLMTGSPQVMFPVGEEGDRLRSFQAALQAGKITSRFPLFYCTLCKKDHIYRRCEDCQNMCVRRYHCRACGDLETETCKHGPANFYKEKDIDINYYFTKAKERLQEQIHPDLIKGVRGTSNKEHLVEHLAKGILRAKYNIYVNKDGTTRYDCTELPLTHFKPK